MNLREERNYQKLLETLDAMELSEENRKLAEQYLDPSAEENRALLSRAQRQDFSTLSKEQQAQCRGYMEHCKKRNRMEEAGRFVRFAAAVGGSTAYYVMVAYGWNLNNIMEYLTKEQAEAIRAEGIVWNNYALKNVVAGNGQKDPEVLCRAMELCYHKSDNAKSLLAALVLYYSKPKQEGGFLKNLFAKDAADKKIQDIVQYLENNLIASLPNMFTGVKPTEEELNMMQSFVRDSAPEAPFPSEIFSMINGKTISDYLVELLAGEAFLGIEHSNRFRAFLRLAAAFKPNATLDICWVIGGRNWFLDHIEQLEEQLPMSRENYFLWCMERKAEEPVKRMVAKYPDVVQQAVPRLDMDKYQTLLQLTDQVNHLLYLKMKSSYAGEARRKLAEELTKGYRNYNTGRQEAERYLLGEAGLETLYPFVKDWRNDWDYATDRCRKIFKLKSNGQEQQMYRRAVVLEGLCMRARFFTSYWAGKYQELNRETIGEILEIFEKEDLPVSYQIEALCGIYEGIYQEKEKAKFINECVMVLKLKKKGWEEELVRLAKEGSATVRFLCIRVLDASWKEQKEVLLSCASDSSKQVRELLMAVYGSHKEWEPDIKVMLASKKSQEREMAVLVLKQWGVTSYQQELETALAAEKSKKIKELIQGCLGVQSQEEEVKIQTTQQLVKEILKGGKKRKVSWVFETAMPEVHMQDGAPAPEDHLAALLVTYADMPQPGINKDGEKLAKELNPSELASFMSLLLNKWLDDKAEAKKKWVLYAASIHGGEGIIPALHTQIQEWPKAARGAMAAEAVKALALNGSATALLLVDQISRKFKFRQVKTAAGEALSSAAQQLGITRAELEDRIVPNLGFDEGMERTFDYGTRSFRVLLTPALELEVYDEAGKKLKNLPAPGKKDEPEKAKAASNEFKLLKKQLKTVVTNQKLRLEQAMSAERLWPVEKWKELFVKNPVMHQFAMGLIWRLYEEGEPKETFRYMEDGSFNTVEEDEYEFPAEGLIGLVHPIELSEEDLAAWKEQLSDYEVVQPIEQLERPVYRITEDEKTQRELTRFGGKLLNGLSLSGKLQGMGWYRGSVQDAGIYSTFYREDGSLGVELEFSGCYVGDENEEVTVYGARFYRAGTVARGSYVYDTIKKQNEYKLGEISPRYFSEIILQLTKATASSQEQLDYPACKGR